MAATFFSESKTDGLKTLLQLFKIFEFSDQIKSREYLSKHIDRLADLVVQLDKDSRSGRKGSLEVVTLGLQLVSFRNNL